MGATLNNIGLVHSSLGQYELGLTFYHQALKTRQEIGDHQGKGTTLHNVGFAYKQLHQTTQAFILICNGL